MSRYRGLFVHGALSESELVARLRLFVLWKISRLLKMEILSKNSLAPDSV